MNFKKLPSARLLKLLDHESTTHEEKIEIKSILNLRDEKQTRAMQRLEFVDINELLTKYELDWMIQLCPLCAQLNDDYEMTVHPKFFWPVRLDSLAMLGRFACSGDKDIMQNSELIELGLRLANAEDSEVTFAKALGDGGSVMLAIKAGQTVKVGPDVVQRYIYILDNRTGEHGLRIGFGETNLRCTNQMNFVNNNAAHKLRHTKTMRDRLGALIETFDTLQEEIDEHNTFVNGLTERTFNEDQWIEVKYRFIDLLTDVDLTNDFANERVPAGYDVAVKLDDCIEEEVEAIGWSLWTLLNGVTRLTTHEREILYPRSTVPELEYDLAYGKAGELTTKAYQILWTL